MKKFRIVIIIVCILITALGIGWFAIDRYINKNLADVNSIKTDSKFENVTYDKVEDLWDDSVLGILTIDKIGLNVTVKEGSTNDVLKDYIGHIESTATYDGNIGLAGHNRGYGDSFFARLNELEVGDIVKYKTKFYERTYRVDNIQAIFETDWSLLENTKENKLTMITCIPNRREQRLCVQATEVTCNIAKQEVMDEDLEI